MLKMLAASAAGVVCLAGCASTIGLPHSSPSGFADAGSQAAGVRAHVALLYGEHTYVLAKLAVAAAAGRKDEYRSYAGLLAANSDDLAAIFSRAAGESLGNQIGQALELGDGYYVDYLVAAVTNQNDAADAATNNLNTKYVPQLAQLMSSSLNISASSATRMFSEEVVGTNQFLSVAAKGLAGAYGDVRAAYKTATATGAALGEAIVWKFHDKYPGEAADSASRVRTQLDALLQEHAYLTSMATDAAANAGPSAEFPAAASYLDESTPDLSSVIGTVFGVDVGNRALTIWLDQNRSFVAYASASDDASRRDALDGLNQRSTPALTALLNSLHVSADVAAVTEEEIGVIDDQRAKSYDVLAAEDRQSAVLLVSLGDLMMGTLAG
ncbi:MAG TPA: hypothetical protein VFL29_00025 [Candidatus Dormibacteraeota bacterium]|nr:hypothetical protein [Candidatus Dormibacteraeota bacterium]